MLSISNSVMLCSLLAYISCKQKLDRKFQTLKCMAQTENCYFRCIGDVLPMLLLLVCDSTVKQGTRWYSSLCAYLWNMHILFNIIFSQRPLDITIYITKIFLKLKMDYYAWEKLTFFCLAHFHRRFISSDKLRLKASIYL